MDAEWKSKFGYGELLRNSKMPFFFFFSFLFFSLFYFFIPLLTIDIGDCKGNVILFNPAQDDSILSHTISNPLCAIAPSADCTTFALGYVVTAIF